MSKDTMVRLQHPERGQDVLSTMLREGAQRLIAEAVQTEFEEFLSQFAGQRDELGRAAVVRNGFQPGREVLTGLGPVAAQADPHKAVELLLRMAEYRPQSCARPS